MFMEYLKRGDRGKMIVKFRGKYFFLSNFYPATVCYDGLLYNSSEAAYQAQKAPEGERKAFQGISAKEAKALGETYCLPEEWAEQRVYIMRRIVEAKFCQNADLMKQLLETRDVLLVEGNDWQDTFWGVDIETGQGENHLGKILMEVREKLRENDICPHGS